MNDIQQEILESFSKKSIQVTEEQIKYWENYIVNSDETVKELINTFINMLYETREQFESFTSRPISCPLLNSWKKSERAEKIIEVINETLLTLTKIESL